MTSTNIRHKYDTEGQADPAAQATASGAENLPPHSRCAVKAVHSNWIVSFRSNVSNVSRAYGPK